VKRIGIVMALAAEAACLVRPPAPGAPLAIDDVFSLVLCGSGPQRARRGAELLIAAGTDALLSLGFAGGLSPAIVPGALLLPHTVIAPTRRFDTTGAWRSRVAEQLRGAALPVHEGMLLAADKIVAEAPAKTELRGRTGADAVDMESAAILEIAEQRGLPALVLRVALDASDMDIPAAVIRHSDPYGRVRLLPLIAEFLRQPASVASLIRLAAGYRAAHATLRRIGRDRARLLAPREAYAACLGVPRGL
jgi:adenosylhomocysteine nucleosidase